MSTMVQALGHELSGDASYCLVRCARQLLRDGVDFELAMQAMKVSYVRAAVVECGGVKKQAAARLKISRKHLAETLKQVRA